MELGNMLFGNSRGEYPVPLDDSWRELWEGLMHRMNRSWRGQPETGGQEYVFENDVFVVRPYDWGAECDCGASEKMEAWHEQNVHGPACYQTRLRQATTKYDADSGYAALDKAAFGCDRRSPLPGMIATSETFASGVQVSFFKPRADATMDAWRAASNKRAEFQDALYKRLCDEHKLTHPDGCAVHCDCGLDERAEIHWGEIGDHAEKCRLIQPNFHFKLSGFRLNWYKYPFRDSYMSENLSLQKWNEMLALCAASLS